MLLPKEQHHHPFFFKSFLLSCHYLCSLFLFCDVFNCLVDFILFSQKKKFPSRPFLHTYSRKCKTAAAAVDCAVVSPPPSSLVPWWCCCCCSYFSSQYNKRTRNGTRLGKKPLRLKRGKAKTDRESWKTSRSCARDSRGCTVHIRCKAINS